ncbi:hypothetical protein BY996DRAFT_6652901 [Phakopsora pachyrhizi]|nr:hypothetical protein BY996DRAFT_6652901 [Phakopsora pachyrhizi]
MNDQWQNLQHNNNSNNRLNPSVINTIPFLPRSSSRPPVDRSHSSSPRRTTISQHQHQHQQHQQLASSSSAAPAVTVNSNITTNNNSNSSPSRDYRDRNASLISSSSNNNKLVSPDLNNHPNQTLTHTSSIINQIQNHNNSNHLTNIPIEPQQHQHNHHHHHHHHHPPTQDYHRSNQINNHSSSSRQALRNVAVQPQVERSPASCMYWSKASIHGTRSIKPLRAHTATLVNDAIWIFGGTDLTGCFKDVWKLDLECLCFTKMKCRGSEESLAVGLTDEEIGEEQRLNDLGMSSRSKTFGNSSSTNNNNNQFNQSPSKRSNRKNPKDHIPPPCRAHSATNLDGRIFIFGGGDGPNYFDDLYYLDTISLTWTKPRVKGTLPSTRRAHATVLYGNQLIIFGGGNGSRALNDVHALDLSDLNQLEWRELAIKGQSPLNRGYHSANLVGSKCVIFGGSDGGECFSDIHVLDLENLTWIQVDVEYPIARLAHTATQVGSYLFVIGGHDGEDYTSDVKLFNLVTLQWEPRTVRGELPPRIGYHTTTLHDSRLIVIGGFDGRNVFDKVWCLELASSAYLPQVTNFSIPIDEL